MWNGEEGSGSDDEELPVPPFDEAASKF